MKALLVVLALLMAPAFASEAAKPLTETMVKNVILNWYSITNEHRPVAELLSLATDDIEFVYPDTAGNQRGHAALRAWYEDALAKYFDETHAIENWQEIKITGNQAKVKLIVRWERREWNPGDARSRYLANLAWQTYDLVRDPDTGRIAVSVKSVGKFTPTAPIHDVSR
ncbi:nuclear transport factor 2 family protein [Propionivibrio sp.]|uniref:nuclear transport factor 2 family protein n=1 Tax=Propionivibrio sp. TaxID=2212460 RepID=UPI003BF0DB33